MSIRQLVLGTVSKTKTGRRIVYDYRYRAVFFGACSLFINAVYAVYHGFLGITQLSVWFVTMWAYYMILGVVRFSAVLCARGNKSSFSADMGVFVIKVSGVLLLILSFVLIGVIYISLSRNIVTRFDKITMITIAAYVFGKIILSVRKVMQRRKFTAPALAVLRNISFAEAAASVFTLQRSMIVSFGEMEYAYVLDRITGAAVCLFVMTLGIKMIVQSRRYKIHSKHKK